MPLHDLLFRFNGRVTRSEWWTGMLLCLAAATLGSFLLDPGVWTAQPTRAPSSILAAWLIACTIPATLVTVKRCNDRDWPRGIGLGFGALVVTMILAEQKGFLVEPGHASWLDWMLFGLAVAIGLAYAADNGLLTGTPGPNRHGLGPHGR